MDQADHQKNLKKNTVVSIFSLFFQSGYAAILGLIANLVLTISLPPATFGIYILTLSIISFLNYFSDIGLAASLVQKAEVSDDDIATTFTVQQLLIVSLLIIAFLVTPVIQNLYNLPQNAIYLYWALLVAFFLSSLKTIPSIMLERQVQFQKIVLVQVVENTIFYVTVSILALAGFDLFSFVYAVLIRAICGTLLMYYLSFWMPRFTVNRTSLKGLLSFGLPFQTNTFLALVKDDLILLYLGKVLGLEALGYIGWAKRWAEAPIRMIMDNISRILFPIFARLQHEKDKVSKLTNKILFFQTMLLAPVYTAMLLLMHFVVELIPKYNKWEPALPIFYLLCISAFLSSYSTPFINLFNALGKVKISFRYMLYWTVMTWILMPILTTTYGVNGFAYTLIFLSLTCFAIMIHAKKYIDLELVKNVVPFILASAIMGVVVFGVEMLGVSLLTLIITSLVGAAVYLGILIGILRIPIIHEIRSIFKYE
ncbi:MAG: oligosaccharide flippase family protein [Weeksellaceae bacterium]